MRLIGVEGLSEARMRGVTAISRQLMATWFEATVPGEERTQWLNELNPVAHVMLANAINHQATMLPLSTTAAWQLATVQDPDLAYLEYCLLVSSTKPKQDDFSNVAGYKEWKDGILEAEAELVYQYKTKKTVGLRAIQA